MPCREGLCPELRSSRVRSRCSKPASLRSRGRATAYPALLDFPNYANVGDSAVWLGAAAVLRRLTGRPPVHVGGQGRFGLVGLARRLRSGTIYITGGGNFGDLWPSHQGFRERLLARFPDNRIVQLPQSIHFKSTRPSAAAPRRSAAMAPSTSWCATNPARPSPESISPARSCGARTVAFGLGTLEPSGDPSCSLFGLLRTDKERSPADRSPLAALRPRVGGLGREPGPQYAQARPAARWRGMVERGLSGFGSATAFHKAAQRRLDRGIRMLSSGSQVITDRLHGHILSVLLGIPHVALDNSYGKIAAYYRGWTTAPVRVCSSLTLRKRPRPCCASPAAPGQARTSGRPRAAGSSTARGRCPCWPHRWRW